MVYKLAEEDKLCGVIYPTYEGFKPIPKATCEMLESKCDKTEIIVKCKDNQSEEDKKPESQSGSASASASESTSVSNSVSESSSESTSAESTSVSESTTKSTTTSESTSVSTSESNSESVSTNSTSESSSVSSSTSTSNSTSESTTSVSNSQSESTLMSTSESKSESISASGSTSLSNSTSTSTSVSNSLSTTEAPSESELASTSLSEISSEEFVAHSNEISTIEDSLKRATEILNGMINEEIYVRRGNPYKPMYIKETVLNALSRANSIYANKLYLSENLTVNDVHIDPRYKMDSEHEPYQVPLVFDITLPWGGRRTMVVPTNVRYLDEDIDKPEPDRYIDGHTEEIPADMSRDNLINTLNLHYIFGQATFDGDTLIHLRNSNGGELTKEDFTKFEEYVSKKSEDILNKGISGTHKYHAKAELRQETKEGARVFTQKEVNIFSLHILVTQPSGSDYLIGEPVTTAIIDTL